MLANAAAQFRAAVAILAFSVLVHDGTDAPPAIAQDTGKGFGQAADHYAKQLLRDGKQTFRFDTFGSEEFWGGQLKLHRAIEGEKLGGAGAGISPKKALELGLKVDMEAVPKKVAAAIKAGKVDLNDPANTILLSRPMRLSGLPGSSRLTASA